MRIIVTALMILAGIAAGQELPVGANPPALEFPHFPSRMHAFVWRNWNLVDTAHLARVLQTSEENVRQIADSMGLEPSRPIPASYRSHLYLSIIRRNWHLLPYEQLLDLLDMNPRQMAQTLREDDFLWIKLGALKPKCDKLVYAPPDGQVLARCAQIKAMIKRDFPERPGEQVEPPLAFVDRLNGAIPDDQVRPARPDPDHPRFLYSYFAVFGDPLSDPSLDPYPDALLQRYADLGVNGVWLHVVLRDLATSADFPEFGAGSQQRLANLAKLVARAKRFNIGVYLYMNEPRAMPKEFFAKADRRELAGVTEGDHVTMCTSSPVVRKWLGESLTHVFKAVPDLAGVFTITASENLTNCASHGQSAACPHCKNRKPGDIIAEVNKTIEQGVHAAAPNARFIAWDWGWPDSIAPDIIGALPASTWLMSVSEWSLPLDRGGVKSAVGEYSISAVGPGPRALDHWQLAKSRGLRAIAKVQASNTWELSAVPYLPVYDLIARHAGNLSRADVDGVMFSWSLGGYPSPNLEIFQRILRKQDPQAVLDDLAARQFGPGAPHARRAWSLLSEAFEQYPYSGATVYNAPQQFGPSNLFFAQPTHYHSTMIGFPYDDLDGWRGPYSATAFISQFAKVSKGWEEGLRELSLAVDHSGNQQPAAQQEFNLARAAGIHLDSVRAQSAMVLARRQIADKSLPAETHQKAQETYRQSLLDEIDHATQLYRLQRQDSRIGFEASNHYYYLPHDLQEKVLNCRQLLRAIEK